MLECRDVSWGFVVHRFRACTLLGSVTPAMIMELCRSMGRQRCCDTQHLQMMVSQTSWHSVKGCHPATIHDCRQALAADVPSTSHSCMVQQDVHNNSSSQGSRSNRPFGSTFSPSARRPAGHSPALSQSSVPSHATNGHHFYPTLGQSPSDSAAARPSGLDRIDSGCTEPGKDLTYIYTLCTDECLAHAECRRELCM